MNLREQLRDILPNILPEDPAQAVKGTELIQLAKLQLTQDYSDATLRYHFSIMCCDPSSPIAKVEQGQGYYRRSPLNSIQGAQNLITLKQGHMPFGEGDEGGNIAMSRAMKFRTIFTRHCESNARFPFLFDQDPATAQSRDALWRMPNAALVDWEVSDVAESGNTLSMKLDTAMMRMKQSLGLAPYTLSSVKMKLEADPDAVREEFFQCLSQSSWAHRGELVFAAKVEGLAADTLRDLGNQYGIAVSSFGIDLEKLDEWGDAMYIHNMGDIEFERLLSDSTYRTITTGKDAAHLDWPSLLGLCREFEDFQELIDWVTSCADSGLATPYKHPRSAQKASGE